MGYAKERGKFEKLAAKVNAISIYDDKSLAVIADIYEQYSHSVRILKNKNPEVFTALYQTDLEQVKAIRKTFRESEAGERAVHFTQYKETLNSALNTAIAATKETI